MMKIKNYLIQYMISKKPNFAREQKSVRLWHFRYPSIQITIDIIIINNTLQTMKIYEQICFIPKITGTICNSESIFTSLQVQ